MTDADAVFFVEKLIPLIHLLPMPPQDALLCSLKFTARVRERPEGSIYACTGGSVQTLEDCKEALSLRLGIRGEQ
eukprot:5647258-Lingulodinium_polyedra.AAC.1